VLALPDLGVRAAAIASGGSAVALHVRDHAAPVRRLSETTRRFLSLAGPPEASVIVNGHPEVAQGLGAQGVQLRGSDLEPADARRVFPHGWLGRSVHNVDEAERMARSGVDYLLVGAVFPTPSHPDRVPAGLDLVKRCGRLGLPVIAIGGITLERIPEVQDAGAYGIAAIRAFWHSPDPAGTIMAMLDQWSTQE
jgi:thiamine-phosphate pyrophosphorylase